MTIHLREHLERYEHDPVLAGRFRTEDDVILDARERCRQAQQSLAAASALPDPRLGCMCEEAVFIDEIVADAYRHRREETWREIDRGSREVRHTTSSPTTASAAANA